MALKLKNISFQAIIFVESTFNKQDNLFVCGYIQITLLEHLTNDKTYNFHTLCSFTINKSLMEVATRLHTDLYKYLNKVYLKKGFTALLNAKKLNGYIEYMREKKHNNKQPAPVFNLANKTQKAFKQEAKKSKVDDKKEYQKEMLVGTQPVDLQQPQ